MRTIENSGAIFTKAIEAYGIDAQLMVVFEEVGELLTAISHYNRGRCELADVITEIADVKIMLAQLEVILGCQDEAESEIHKKLSKVAGKLGLAED